ncbi:MAG: hypothetical protein ACO2PO_16510 [Candidatus Calescibacterium sp.]
MVREDGYFECSGCAYDFGSKPDPYVYIVPRNSVLEVRDCRVKDQYFRVVLKEFGPQGSGEKEVGTKNNPVVIPDIFRAPYWIFRAIYISWVRNFDEMRKVNLWDVRVENLRVCYPAAGKFYYDSSERKICVLDSGAYAISEVAKLFGYAMMHRLYEYSSDFPLFGGGGIFGMCYSYLKNTDLAKKLAFIDGFSTAIALFTFDTSIYCFGGEPDKCETDVFLSYIDFEGSTSIREPWSSYIEAKRWENHWCDKLFGIGGPLAALSSLRTYSWESAGYVASAIWDLYDDMTEADKNLWKVCKWNDERYEYVYTYDENARCDVCSFHRAEGLRYPCDELKLPWKKFLEFVYRYKPKDYIDFVRNLAFRLQILIDEKIDRVSKFNGIEFLPQMPRQVEINVKKLVTKDSLKKIVSLNWNDCSGVESEFRIYADEILYHRISTENNRLTFFTLYLPCDIVSYEDEILPHRFGKPHCYQVAAWNTFGRSRKSPFDYSLCVPNISPRASLTVSISDISQNIVIPDASRSYDEDGVIWIYKWDCGYYVPDEVLNQIRDQVRNLFGWEIEIRREGNYLITPYGINRMVCIYSMGGNYEVSVIVVDDEGYADVTSEVVSVFAPSQPIPEQPPFPQPPPSEEGIGCYSVPPIYSAFFWCML